MIASHIRLIQCSNFKYLGITIDETLSWVPHLNELKRRLSRVLGILYRLRFYLNFKDLCGVYYALFHSILNYGNIVWGHCSLNKTKGLLSIQRRAIDILRQSYLCFNFENEFIRPFEISEIYTMHLGIFYYKILNGLLPYLLQRGDYLLMMPSPHTHFTRNALIPRLPKFNTRFARTSVYLKIIDRFVFFSTIIDIQKSKNIIKNSLKKKILEIRT